MEQCLQAPPQALFGEDQPAQGGPIQHITGPHQPRAELGPDLRHQGLAGGGQGMGDGVGVAEPGPECGEQLCHRGLAAADTAGEGNREQPPPQPRPDQLR